jgi:hypothetical protein
MQILLENWEAIQTALFLVLSGIFLKKGNK